MKYTSKIRKVDLQLFLVVAVYECGTPKAECTILSHVCDSTCLSFLQPTFVALVYKCQPVANHKLSAMHHIWSFEGRCDFHKKLQHNLESYSSMRNRYN